MDVNVDGKPAPVVEKNRTPSVQLTKGKHKLTGKFSWTETPQKIAVPKTYGIIDLKVDRQSIAMPNWDDQGNVWLKRQQADDDGKDEITFQIFRVLEDGSPMWLRTQIDMTISGKSREEEIGNVLPEGWQLSFVAGAIPVALDDQGKMKAQVRAGTWQIRIDAFRNQDLRELRYAESLSPAAEVELIGVRSKPELRSAEIQGALPVDVQMTTFPQAWRELPVYEWRTVQPLKWVEKSRGMGSQSSARLSIQRRLWLDETGQTLTFQDRIQGSPKQISRLDVADQHELGVVRIDGTRQLITENPMTHAHGIELRSGNPNIEAIGTTVRAESMSATGWNSDVDSLRLSLVLPPGWRALALFGADHVEGDWLTAWSLLDLFLLLVFSIAVYRLWGGWAGAIAFLAFGLTYHELGSPRFTWLFLLVPSAILHVVKVGRIVAWLKVWRFFAMGLLLLNLIPFGVLQIQNALYPQLERVGVPYDSRSMFDWLGATYNQSAVVVDYGASDYLESRMSSSDSIPMAKQSVDGKLRKKVESQIFNMQFDPGTSIQTGIAKPQWAGTEVQFYWDGPVSTDQTYRPILISRFQHRCLTVVRVVLLSALVAIFLGVRSCPWLRPNKKTVSIVTSALLFVLTLLPNSALSQVPDEATLKLLRERLLPSKEAFPTAAEYPSMSLKVTGGKIVVQAEVHAAVDVAVPVPGKFPSWSPVKVLVNGEQAIVCRRDDGCLWVWVPQGVQRLEVEGFHADRPEWEWSMELIPRSLQVDAPEWNMTGLRPEGHPESQLFFSRKEQREEGAANYDQKNFKSVALVDRQVEVGLIWKVHNVVRRLSSVGKAFSIQIPLLPGERVTTSNLAVDQGVLDVNLSAEESEFRWESEMNPVEQLTLESPEDAPFVQRWSLVSSPVWNASFEGLQPIYEAGQSELLPTWQPWPGEKTVLRFRRPTAVPGETLTIQGVTHDLTLGQRQRTSRLSLQVESSLGGDFPLALPEKAVVTKIELNDRSLPIRNDGGKHIVSLQPGAQNVEVEWNEDKVLGVAESFPTIELPTDSANITSRMQVPESQWILWTDGPIRGPAVRFWVVLLTAIGAALVLSSLSLSPLKRYEWLFLVVGLTQVNVIAGLIVVAWLFLLAWRGTKSPVSMNVFGFNMLQVGLVGMTLISLGILLVVVGQGLLGNPEMFILGNGSDYNSLNWFEPNSDTTLPVPRIIAISVWYYRLLMLVWALWLANALLRWLQNGWASFTTGGAWAESPRVAKGKS